MSEAYVRIWPPAPARPKAIKVRVHTSDFAVVGEGPAGWPLQVPPGEGYVASAIDGNGRAIGRPVRFDVQPQDGELNLRLQALDPPPAAGRILLESASPPAAVAPSTAFPAARDDAAPVAVPAFRYVRVLRRRARSQESVASDDFREMFAIEELDPNQPPVERPVGSICAFGLLFAGPNRRSRLAVMPVDCHAGQFEVPQIRWSGAHTPGVYLPYFEFTDTVLNFLIGTLRQGQRPSLASAPPLGTAWSGAAGSRSGLARVITALNAVDDPERWQELERETSDWAETCKWIPDAQVLRAELLARMGSHSRARVVLRQIAFRTLPWTRTALFLLASRLSFYDREQCDSRTWRYRKIWYQNLLGQSHPSCSFCVFELGGNRHG